ncbi:hypothetical protein AJ79_01619 [Helicocarpus griseus UAMH5409]|uniref:Macro-like domain-containing protein n=1 Tax=Helicocarpus griseus UAMH5409 TaxID=1447875 RepID=A0A2B7Y5I9_9EURO|nr:hypothetical protein AJ79_01619 [Helicocarpus griseus UAMH5409]
MSTQNPLIDLPEFLLLCKDEENITAFKDALRTYWPSMSLQPSPPTVAPNTPQKLSITPLHSRLDNTLPPTTTFDLIVSPANSYARLDGAFDDAISRTFCPPPHNYNTLTHAAQKVLYERWRGYAPPGTCTLVLFPEEIAQTAKWGCRFVAICPTMRMPENVVWDREVVYKCVWGLLGEVEGWNRRVREGKGDGKGKAESDKRIGRVLMPPLAVGVGKVSKERWAGQVVLAMKHFVDALERPERWSRLDWAELGKESFEVSMTWRGEESGKGKGSGVMSRGHGFW